MGLSPKYDWDSIQNEYVIGYRSISESTGLQEVSYPTLKELAEKYNISESYVKEKAHKGQWTELRRKLQQRHQHENLKTALSPDYSESAQFDARILNSANRLLGVVEAFFGQYEHLKLCADGNFRYIPPGHSDDEEDPVKNIKVSDLKGLVEVLDKTQTLVRRTLGEPTNNVESKRNGAANQDSVESMIKQRDTIKRQQEGLQYQLEEIERELNE